MVPSATAPGINEFGVLADALEVEFAGFGSMYQHGTGDILIVQDDYGTNEIGVIFNKSVPEDQVTAATKRALSRVGEEWEVWLTFQGVGGATRQVVVTLDGVRYETS